MCLWFLIKFAFSGGSLLLKALVLLILFFVSLLLRGLGKRGGTDIDITILSALLKSKRSIAIVTQGLRNVLRSFGRIPGLYLSVGPAVPSAYNY